MDNQQIANIFHEIGNLLEIDEANHFRVLAYKNAADNIRGLGRELKDIWLENAKELENIPGIGKDLKSKIEEILKTGTCDFHSKLLKKYGHGILDIINIRGIGPKKTALFYKNLKIDNLNKLKKAAKSHKLRRLPRMGEKSELAILQAIEDHEKHKKRMLLSEALPLAEEIVKHLLQLKEIAKVEYAGSLRRRKETVGDLDILAAPHRPNELKNTKTIIEHFTNFALVKNVIAKGPTKCSVILSNGVQADLRVVKEKSFGAALHYFTGSKDHNIEIRSYAQKAGKKINEYGIFDILNIDNKKSKISNFKNKKKSKNVKIKEKFIVGDSEENFYKAIGLPWIHPTLREMRGEFEAAMHGELPKEIKITDLNADLNTNSSYAKGTDTIKELCKKASKAGISCLAIADTFNSEEFPTEFNETKLKLQINEIENLNKNNNFLILKSLKLSINTNGSLNLPNQELLKKLDFLIIKINHNFNLTESKQTSRIIKALSSHPKVKILSCPNSRIINKRNGIAINTLKIIEYCAKHGKFLEINSQPNRLDLFDTQIKIAIKKRAGLCINSDALNGEQFKFLQYGVWTAQRGWAEKKHILNAIEPHKIQEILRS